MSGRRAIVGLCMLCALVFSAVAAQGAQAATEGTTAFTCINTGTGTLWGEHCLGSNPGHGETQGWKHVVSPQGEVTHATLTNEKTGLGTVGAVSPELTVTVGGVMVKLVATEVHGTGHLHNVLSGEEHSVVGSGTITFSHVTVAEPEHCKVEGVTAPGGAEMVTTTALTATTAGQGMGLKFSPETGESLTELTIANNGGTCAAAQANVNIVGTVKGVPDNPGATTTFNAETMITEGTLHFGGKHGPAAGLGGKITITAGKEPITEPTHPISATTPPFTE
jgi:hypothetical protein